MLCDYKWDRLWLDNPATASEHGSDAFVRCMVHLQNNTPWLHNIRILKIWIIVYCYYRALIGYDSHNGRRLRWYITPHKYVGHKKARQYRNETEKMSKIRQKCRETPRPVTKKCISRSLKRDHWPKYIWGQYRIFSYGLSVSFSEYRLPASTRMTNSSY